MMFKCKYCGRESKSKSGIMIHEKYCNNNPNRYYVMTNGEISKTVQKDEYNKLLNDGWYLKSNFRCNNKTSSTKGKIWINNGSIHKIVKEEELDNYIKNGWVKGYSEEYKKTLIGKSKGIASTPEKEKERRLKISQSMKNNDKCGGYRKNSGIGKKGKYKNIYCDSSWELAFVAYHIDNNMFIERCTERRTYVYNNKEHIYIPDFVTDEGIIEIKGYKSEQWLAKLQQNNDIKVLYQQDILFYIQYVEDKYGKDWINTLYNK